VLLAQGWIVSRIKPDSTEGSPALVSDLATVAYILGGLALVSGYCAFLLARVSLQRAIESLVLSAVSVLSYWWTWWVALAALNGDAASIVGIKDLGLTGRWAALGSIGMIGVAIVVFIFAFRWWTGIVWPFFRSGVALNVTAMVHIVVFLLGVASFLNVRFTPQAKWATVDLTETGRYSLSDKTRAVLGKVDGELLVYLVDYGADRRNRAGIAGRVQDLLQQYMAACPRMSYRQMDALRSGEDLHRVFAEAGMDNLLGGFSGDEDVVVFGYRPPGEKLVARTRVVSVNQEFADTSALGNERFRGEGILTNAVNEVVFAQRKILLLEGHNERPTSGSAGPQRSVAVMADALRGDNFAVSNLNLVKDPVIPADTDLVCIVDPQAPLSGGEVEALKGYLGKGGAVMLFLDVPGDPDSSTGLEELLDNWGIRARRDAMIVSWMVERTVTRGDIPSRTAEIYASQDEFGRHPAMEALRGSSFGVSFQQAVPIFKADKVPEGVDVQELVYAPREVRGYKPWAAILRKGRKIAEPQPGDIVDKRLPVGVAAERKAGPTDRGGGRLVVFGDADFASDLRLDTTKQTAVPANRTLILNIVSWAVRRDLIAIDPKTVETEIVQLRSIDKDLAFWAMVVALPVLALGVAVGVWWSRRR
jgi:ABC-type uncharacterized transport system involved in gliding motility auxiliary subunit